MLQVLDVIWKEHLAAMDYLRQGIHLRGYAQKNPKQEYKRESFEMFRALLERFKTEVTRLLSRGEIRPEEETRARTPAPPPPVQVEYSHAEVSALALEAEMAAATRRGSAPGTGAGGGPAVRAAWAQGRPQRAVSLRLGKEVQALPRAPALGVCAAENDAKVGATHASPYSVVPGRA